MISAAVVDPLILILLLVTPVWDVYETRRLRRENNETARLRAYAYAIIWLWGAAVLLHLSTPFAILNTPARPPYPPQSADFLGPMSVGAAIAVFMPVVLVLTNARARERTYRQLQKLDFILPTSRRERAVWPIVAISAGICEEIIFRGFLIRYLDRLFGHPHIGIAIAAASLLFGVQHTYQGVAGMIVTAILAALFALIFYATYSLVFPMVFQALIDLLNLVLYRRPSTMT